MRVQAKERAKRLLGKRPSVGWMALALAAWGKLDEADTMMGLPETVSAVWGWIASPWGFWSVFATGLCWLAWLVIRPAEEKTPTTKELDARVGALAKLESTVNENRELAQALNERSQLHLQQMVAIGETAKEHSDEISRIRDRVEGIDQKASHLRKLVEPVSPFLADVVRAGISIRCIGPDARSVTLAMGFITRKLRFQLEVNHTTADVYVQPTGKVSGQLVALQDRHPSLWSISLPDPKPVLSGHPLLINVDYPVTERLAESLAFKAEHGDVVEFTFAEMEIEFIAYTRSMSHQTVVGYRPCDGSLKISIEDSHAMIEIRDVYLKTHPPATP